MIADRRCRGVGGRSGCWRLIGGAMGLGCRCHRRMIKYSGTRCTVRRACRYIVPDSPYTQDDQSTDRSDHTGILDEAIQQGGSANVRKAAPYLVAENPTEQLLRATERTFPD